MTNAESQAAAQPDERTAFDQWWEKICVELSLADSDPIIREAAGLARAVASRAWRAARATTPQATVKGDEQEPTLYQFRTKPTWHGGQWCAWEECTAEAAADYRRVPLLHDWVYEVRELFERAAVPQAGAALTDGQIVQLAKDMHVLSKTNATWWDVQQDILLPFARALLAAHPTEHRMSDAAREEQPSWTNPLTPYGMLVRALRIVANATLCDMGKCLSLKPSLLSGMETGRKPVTREMASDVATYFESLGVSNTLPALNAALDANRKWSQR